MRIILLERIAKLGFIGDIVDVKVGYARNFLLPNKKALRATDTNLKYFEMKKAEIEANNLKLKSDAEKVATKMADISITLIRQASDSGFLFGSVRPIDIVDSIVELGFSISNGQVKISSPIKSVGLYSIGIVLHPEVIINVSLRVMTAKEQSSPVGEEEAEEETGADQKVTRTQSENDS
ncbi:MAG: 50S ribosomal protein L9 [Holosporales bacterium]|jgi:large subunit ribosomal protein L9|nr:50S ribosomal protein L9 [Holosporales bacterium]